MTIVGLVAIVLATVNMVGGFVVTDRMLEMFRRRAAAVADAPKAPTHDAYLGSPASIWSAPSASSSR